MSANSPIEWTGHTWNPTLGCSKKSPGCKFCYAIRTVHRLAGNPNAKIRAANQGLTVIQNGAPNWTGIVRLIPERLSVPLRIKKPTTFFVNSLSDLFHEALSDEEIDQVFAVMALCPQHTFQVLTKTPERMERWFAKLTDSWDRRLRMESAGELIAGQMGWCHADEAQMAQWPLSNLWLGVSVENQRYADERIPLLLQTPAAVRFISAEPLLGPINLEELPSISGIGRYLNALNSACIGGSDVLGALDWVISGGESGTAARPSHPDWHRTLRDQCQAYGVPFFFKQWGGYAPGRDLKEGDEAQPPGFGIYPDGLYETPDCCSQTYERIGQNLVEMRKVGKKKAGALLDGREWREMPQ